MPLDGDADVAGGELPAVAQPEHHEGRVRLARAHARAPDDLTVAGLIEEAGLREAREPEADRPTLGVYAWRTEIGIRLDTHRRVLRVERETEAGHVVRVRERRLTGEREAEPGGDEGAHHSDPSPPRRFTRSRGETMSVMRMP